MGGVGVRTMLRYLLALGLVVATGFVAGSMLTHLSAHGGPTPLDITLASGIYTIAIAARVTL